MMPKAPLPDSGRTSAMGRTSPGMPIRRVTGLRMDISNSIAPEARNMRMATRMATRNGMMRTAMSNPCLAPSVTAS